MMHSLPELPLLFDSRSRSKKEKVNQFMLTGL